MARISWWFTPRTRMSIYTHRHSHKRSTPTTSQNSSSWHILSQGVFWLLAKNQLCSSLWFTAQRRCIIDNFFCVRFLISFPHLIGICLSLAAVSRGNLKVDQHISFAHLPVIPFSYKPSTTGLILPLIANVLVLPGDKPEWLAEMAAVGRDDQALAINERRHNDVLAKPHFWARWKHMKGKIGILQNGKRI